MPAMPYAMVKRVVAIAFAGCCVAPIARAAVAPTSAATTRIPFVVGLTTVDAVIDAVGDYEVLDVITAIDASGHSVVRSGEIPQTNGRAPRSLTATRNVLAADQAKARKMRDYFHAGKPESFPGTVVGFSAAMINDLRATGKAAITDVDGQALRKEAASKDEQAGTAVNLANALLNDVFSNGKVPATDVDEQSRKVTPPGKGEYAGTLVRVVDSSPTLNVLVNGRITPLPVLHVKGTLTGSEGQRPVEFFVLDDPSNPMVLRSKRYWGSSKILRIEYPQPRKSASSIENMLVRNEVAQVYGIYFSFDRAEIRPESKRILDEIAAALKAHPDWKLRVDGHTDGIGNDAANMDLSKRRAAAVKTALVTQYGLDGGRLSTGGSGETSPQATNDTPEGRARNRRVELRRL